MSCTSIHGAVENLSESFALSGPDTANVFVLPWKSLVGPFASGNSPLFESTYHFPPWLNVIGTNMSWNGLSYPSGFLSRW